ncbi:MAG: ferrous iron transport protein B [Treponema sp.]|nr:ferrous iron transport protein B [Treponema sp.]
MKIALAGNPNCGKTTMFNALTGANQYVGNWPGVTVEYKEGKTKANKDLVVTDLPGVYSLSPYTKEEIVTRDYLKSDEPAAVINIIDATNIERNLYLTTQILELGKPVVIALNMMDSLRKSGGEVDIQKLSERLGCKVVETIALCNKGVIEVTKAAEEAGKKDLYVPSACFSKEVEEIISLVMEELPETVKNHLRRWTAIKLLERDSKVMEEISLSEELRAKCESLSLKLEELKKDDIESVFTNERYNFIIDLLQDVVKKPKNKLSYSDKVDRIVTNRWLGIPIFLAVMGFIYWVAVTTVGSFITDWTNNVLIGELLQGNLQNWMNRIGAHPVLIDCVVNGIVGGLGAVLGFVPQMFILFVMLSIVEDCGYMVRIAFVMDRIFRKFGLSGKSFIPLLVGTGCGVPGIMSSRTIENENDRRMTIMTTTWIPCGAKLPVIAMFSAILAEKLGAGSATWVAPLMYAIGIASVVIAAVILKKTKPFHGPAAPFIMELPQYHLPQLKSVFIHSWERTWSFIKKAGTVLFLACLVMWFLASYGIENGSFTMVTDSNHCILGMIGNILRYIFIPLGWGGENGGWQCVASTIAGFSAKEGIVSTLGVLANVSEELIADEQAVPSVASAIGVMFPTGIAAFSFLMFNLLDSPCLAAISAMANELKNKKWFWFAIVFQNVFAYVVTLIIYQLGMLFAHGVFGVGTIFAFIFLAVILFLLFRKNPYAKIDAMD